MLEMILSASIMILVGVLVRFFAINRLPKLTFVVIWGLVSIRLLVPFSLPTAFTGLRLFSFPTFDAVIASSVENIPSAPVATEARSWVSALPLSDMGQVPEPLLAGGINWTALFIGLWVCGSVLLASYFLGAHYRFRKKMRTSLPVTHAFTAEFFATHKICRTIRVRQSDQITSPLTYGILRPVILLPSTMDFGDEEKLNYVLTHELIHVKRFDYAWKLLFAATLCVHWFNPLVWLMYTLTNRDSKTSSFDF